MPRYAIRRQLNPDTTRADVDASAIFTLMHMANLRSDPESAWPEPIPRIDWIRSYWQEGSTWGMCLYAARSATDIEQFHVQCEVDYAEFHPITELVAATRNDPETGKTRLDHDAIVFAVDTPVPNDVRLDDASCEDLGRFLSCVSATGVEGSTRAIEWIRTYWDEGNRRALALYAAPDEHAVRAVAASAGPEVTIRPITEIYPDEYVGA